MQLAYVDDVSCGLFTLAVDKQMTNKTQNIIYLIAEHSVFIKYALIKLDEIIQINDIIFFKPAQRKY